MSREVFQRICRLAERAVEITNQLEAGQATMPLSDGLKALSAGDMSDRSVAIALAGFTPEDASATLAAMVGRDYHVCKIVAPGRMRFFEVSLQECGYLLEHGDSRMEFDNFDSFVSALEKEDLIQTGNPASVLDPVRLHMASPSGRAGIRLLVPEGVEHLVKRPALMSLMAEQADWLLIAGTHDKQPSESSIDVLKTLANAVCGVTCLVVGAEEINSGWWSRFKGYPGFQVLSVSGSTIESLMDRFSNHDSGLKSHLTATRRVKELESALQLANEAIDSERTSLRNKQRLQVAGFSQKNIQDQNVRKSLEEIKTRLQDDLDALRRSIEDRGKKDLTPDGTLYQPLKTLSESISPNNLERTLSGNSIKLALDPENQIAFRRELLSHGRRILEQDLLTLHEAVGLTVEDINSRVESLTGFRKKIAVDYPDFQKMWDSIVSLAHPEVRYRGEMPKITIGARLMSARQGMMWVMMAGMLVTGITAFTGDRGDAQQIRSFLYVLMIPVFFGGLLYSFKSFRDKEGQMLEKETDKLKEGVYQELRKIMSEILRQEQSLLAQFFQRVSRDIMAQVNTQIQESEDRQNREKESQRKQLSEQGKTIEGRLREFDRQQSDLSRINSSLNECERQLRQDRKQIFSAPE